MLGFIIEPLTKVVRDRFLAWFKKQSWRKQVAVLLGVASLGAAIANIGRLPEAYRYAQVVRRVFDSAERYPTSSVQAERMRVAISNLDEVMTSHWADAVRVILEPAQPSVASHNAWSIAQLFVGRSERPQRSVRQLLDIAANRSVCRCWSEYTNEDHQHFAIAAWAFLALARSGASPAPAELDYVLSHQFGGAWPIYTAEKAARNQATYPTALMLLALHELKEKQLIPADRSEGVEQAIVAARTWLRAAQREARWRHYPNDSFSDVSMSTSGLALYAIHRTSQLEDVELDRIWLRSLPGSVPTAVDYEAAAVPVLMRSGPPAVEKRDTSRLYTLPWLIVGTMSALHNGSYAEKAAGIEWLDAAIDQAALDVGRVSNAPWIAAELLISLRYLNGLTPFTAVD